jgi:hypothetical protein
MINHCMGRKRLELKGLWRPDEVNQRRVIRQEIEVPHLMRVNLPIVGRA